LLVEIQIDHRTQGGWDVLDVTGEIDLSSAPALRTRIDQLLEAGSPRLLISLERVGFMDSSGLSVLVSAMKAQRRAGAELAIACVHEQILKIFTVTGLDRVLPIHPSVDAVVGA
jgi:anti-sigma B factor antagonist